VGGDWFVFAAIRLYLLKWRYVELSLRAKNLYNCFSANGGTLPGVGQQRITASPH